MNDEKQTVLVVDDDPNNIAILSKDLSTFASILVAKNGEQALKRAGENHVDLILLDVMMPEMDGYEVCRRLKQDNATMYIPVIFLTSKSEVEDETHGLNLGAVDYIKKPFSLPIVRARVKTHLDLKRKTDILERLATLDGLTAIPNRRRFEEYMDLSWGLARRHQSPISVIMLDIDHFKLYNDNYGHLQGDECLKQVAATLEKSLRRPGDMLARYGGEEFVAVMPETDHEGAMQVGQALCDAVQNQCIPHEFSQTAPHVSISVGVATVIPGDASSTPQALVRAADQMLYQAKESGRNRVCGEDSVSKEIGQ